ncbi:MAG: transglutaminase domain-containing protein, partial [Clostridia bacterium]|nr:transglutaminase domain-containing protein [Clostridia bacterium]
MKKQLHAVLNTLSDGVLITLTVLAAPCTVLTAYSVPYPLVALIFAAIGIGLCLSVWMHAHPFSLAAGILYFAVLMPLLVWKRLDILYGFRIVRYAMLDMLAPDVPFLEAPAAVQIPAGLETLPTDAVGWFVLLVMALLGLSIAWSLIRSKMILLPVIVPIPMFMLSLIYTDLPIAYWAVFLLLLYFGTCLVTGSLRVYDAERCGTVTLAILLGVFLLGVVIRLASPPETYEPISFEQRQRMIGDKVQELVDDVKSALNNRVKHTEDLTDEEEWKRTGDQILSLRTSEAGELYLRAYSLGRYERNAWRSVSNYTGTWQSMAALGERLQRGGDPLLSMEIQAERSEMLYTPYGFVPEEGLKLSESFLTADGQREYEWTFLDEIPETESMPESEAAYLAWAQEQYTITDKTESARLAEFAKAAGLKDTGDNYQTALAVADYVRHHAHYTTKPGPMPEDRDFVLYFLLESREGYCVHFASATTALLQAMGVPARYVFGYRFYASAEIWQDVTDEMAHAWTEVYEPGVG